jgi:hypothetical protein
MKRLAILSMTFLFCLSVIQGQTKEQEKKETKKEQKTERVALRKLEGSNVSTIAKNNFSAEFKDAQNVQWKRVDTYDEATFTNKDNHQMKAFYDFEGKLVGTTQHKTFADVPVKGQEQIKKEYKDYTVGQVLFFDDNEANSTDMILYGIQFEDEDNYFVELSKGNRRIVVHVNMEGSVFFFTELK